MNRKIIHSVFMVCMFVFINVIFIKSVYAEEMIDLRNDNLVSGIQIIPLDNSMVNAAKEFVQQLQTSNVVRVAAMIYAPPGLPPYMVLSGSPEDLQQAMELQQSLLPDKVASPLIIIAASLRELTRLNSRDIGIDFVPNVTGTLIADKTTTSGVGIQTVTKHIEASSNDMVGLEHGLNNSKVLVSSEVYTPNGVKAQISNIKSVPIFSTDAQGNVQTQYQNLETSIAVVPTLIQYNALKPEESTLRLDVEVKVSIISGTSLFKGVSAPEYSVKTMTTTRVLIADNRSNVIGTFVTDSDTKTRSGVPVLGSLPLLKYLFSRESTQQQRNTAVLTLAVRLLPMPVSAQ